MTPTLAPIANHLWQSTLFAGVVALLALALRKNHARARHWLWLAASVKFLIPFSLLISLGNQWLEMAIEQRNTRLSLALAYSRFLTFDRMDRRILSLRNSN